MDAKHKSELGAYEAKTHFSELLDRVANGEELTITRNGTAVARMVPIGAVSDHRSRQAAVEAIRALASCNRLKGRSIKSLIEEGRR
jgi:prevent-host-death family protein